MLNIQKIPNILNFNIIEFYINYLKKTLNFDIFKYKILPYS